MAVAQEERLSFYFLRIILYALLLTPLWVWSIFLFPFITTKILYFRLLLELLVLCYAVLAWKYPEIRPRFNWLLKTVWLYLLVVVVTSIFGLNFGSSFMGTVERGEGIVTLLHFAAYFTILTGVLRTKREWYRYLMFAVSVTLVVALYGLAQLLKAPFVIEPGATRISGTIGNAAFFAAYLQFGVFLSLYLLRQAPTLAQRVYLWVVLLFELVMLFQSQTRGALLATLLAFLLYFLVNLWKTQGRKPKLLFSGLLILFLLAGTGVYLNRHATWVKVNPTLSRLVSISREDITTQSRLDTWAASWRAFRDRLFLGYGYENYNLAFNKYFPARIFKDQGSQIWFDRAHNIVFDVGVTSGVFGLLAFLGIFLAAGVVLVRLFRRPPPSFSWQDPVILAVLLLAYFLQNLFVFDTQATYLMFFVVLAHLAFLQTFAGGEAKSLQAAKSYHPGLVFPVMLAILMVVLAYFVNLQPARANYLTIRAIKAARERQYQLLKPTFERALSLGTYMDQEIRQRMVDYAYEAINSGQLPAKAQGEFSQYLVAELKKNIRQAPHDAKNYLYLMNVLNRFPSSTATIDEVLSLGETALRLSPTRPQIYTELGEAYFAKKDAEQGLLAFRKAVDLNPRPKESRFNYLLAAILAGREDIVQSELQILGGGQPGYELTAVDYQNIARVYFRAGNKLRAIENYQQALKLRPADPDLHSKLAAAYGEACDLPNAQREVDEVVRLNPSFALQAGEFLRQLEIKCQK